MLPVFKKRFSVLNKFRLVEVRHLTDLLAVKEFKRYTILKSREDIEPGTVVDEETFRDLLSRSTAPIVLHEDYLEKDEKGRIIYE